MLNLNIDKSASNAGEMAEYLREVADKVEKGYMIGQDWEMDGAEEKEVEFNDDYEGR